MIFNMSIGLNLISYCMNNRTKKIRLKFKNKRKTRKNYFFSLLRLNLIKEKVPLLPKFLEKYLGQVPREKFFIPKKLIILKILLMSDNINLLRVKMPEIIKKRRLMISFFMRNVAKNRKKLLRVLNTKKKRIP